MMNSYAGVLIEKGERGYYVNINMGGQVGRYGPMQYLSTTREPVEYEPGDTVLVANIGLVSDNFVIMGKLMDINYYPPPPPMADEWGAGPYPFPDQEGT